LYEALRHMGRAWWLAVFPGAALFVTVYGFNRLAEGLRDWLDPRPLLR
jgi:peptide/nickel transport system permease protein